MECKENWVKNHETSPQLNLVGLLSFFRSFIYSFIPFYSDSVLGFKNKMVIKTQSVAD